MIKMSFTDVAFWVTGTALRMRSTVEAAMWI
jgi:hypothetical protein